MARTVTFALYTQDTGDPLLGQPLSFSTGCYKGADGSNRTPPSISHIGEGIYYFTVSDTDEAIGVVYEFSCGPNASPARISGSVGSVVGFAIYDPITGSPLSGQTPTFLTYQKMDGQEVTRPTINDIGSGVYVFFPIMDIDVDTISYMISTGGVGVPEKISGSFSKVQGSTPPGPTLLGLNNSGTSLSLNFSTLLSISGNIFDVKNWSITNTSGMPIIVNNISLSIDTKTLILNVSPQTNNAPYTLHIPTSGISDLNGVMYSGPFNVNFSGVHSSESILLGRAITARLVEIIFSGPVNESDALTATNYKIDGLEVYGVKKVSGNVYQLVTSRQKANNVIYVVIVTGIRDIYDNPIDETH